MTELRFHRTKCVVNVKTFSSIKLESNSFFPQKYIQIKRIFNSEVQHPRNFCHVSVLAEVTQYQLNMPKTNAINSFEIKFEMHTTNYSSNALSVLQRNATIKQFFFARQESKESQTQSK